MSNPWKDFGTNASLETEGVKVDFGGYWVTVRRAGGANKDYAKAVERHMRPHRRAIANNSMSPEAQERVSKEIFVDSVIIGWGSDEYGEGAWPPPPGESEPLQFNRTNLLRVLDDPKLRDLWIEILTQAQSAARFRDEELEDDSGNSETA